MAFELKYWRFVALREWKIVLLFVVLGVFFCGIYHVHSKGIWSARKGPYVLEYGRVHSLWTEVGYYSSLQPRAYIRVNFANRQNVTLRVKSSIVAKCNPGDEIQVRVLTGETGKVFYRVGRKLA